jgi:hypothetical protein
MKWKQGGGGGGGGWRRRVLKALDSLYPLLTLTSHTGARGEYIKFQGPVNFRQI